MCGGLLLRLRALRLQGLLLLLQLRLLLLQLRPLLRLLLSGRRGGAAALGLGALVKAFPAAFKVIAVLGALYVAWLGIKALRGAFATAADPDEVVVKKGRSALIDGFAVQIANPKAILFFTAVLPPFIDVNRPVAPQMAMFAMAAIGMDMVSMSTYALSGAALSRRMQQPRFRKGFGVFVGLLLMVAAVLIVLRL